MNTMFRSALLTSVFTLGAVSLMTAAPAFAQTTVSSIRGNITDISGNPIDNASVQVVDTRTGASRTVSTNASGSYSVRNLSVGGPYSVTVTKDGLQGEQVENIFVNLSGSSTVNIDLDSGSAVDEIIVTATRQSVTQVAIGPSAVFSSDIITSAPSISRDIRDVIRIDPRLTVSGGDDQVSCLGGSPRSTSFTVDGVSVNDQFGLNASGTPARANFPVPFDAIQETAVEFAPYSVEYGNFEGCVVNIVTKRGANELSGNAFFVYNNRNLTGDTINGQQILGDADFDDFNWGLALRGPIIKDKLFFSVTYEEIEDGGSIVGFGPNDGAFSNPIPNLTTAELGQIDSAVTALGFPTGGAASVIPETSRRVFTRIDWNINDNHRLELGYDFEEELEVEPDLAGFQDVSFQFLNSFENSGSDIDRYSARLFSNWNDNFSTEVRFSRAEINDIQGPVGGGEAQSANPIPRIIIQNNAAGDPFDPGEDGILVAGPGTFRAANALNTTLDEFKIKGDYSHADHLFTVGYEFQNQDVFNLFVPDSTGTFIFDDLAALQAGTANTILATSTGSGDVNDAAAEFSRTIHSVYAQDVWRPNSEWTLTAGLRYDFYRSDDTPEASPVFQQRYGFSNGAQAFDGLDILLPRFGVEYTPGETIFGESRFRGGIGVFSGGFPNVSFSNAFTNNGFGTAFAGSFGGDCTNADLQVITGGTFTGIPQCIQDQISASTAAGTGRTDAIDPSLEVASILRTSVGLTHFTDFGGAAKGFFDDWRFDADFIYSNNRNSFDFVDLTLTPNGITLPDGRPQFNAIDPLLEGCDATFLGPRLGFTAPDLTQLQNGGACDAGGDDQDILLTNVDGDAGRSYSLSFRLAKTFDYQLFGNDGSWRWNLGYSYTDSTAVVANLSSTATSSFEEIATAVINNPVAGPASFQNPHVFTLATSVKQEFVKDYPTRLSAVFVAREGNPFSFTFDNNTPTTLFGDSDNEERNLFYVPTGPNDPLVQFNFSDNPDLNQQLTSEFFRFIEGRGLDEFSGEIVDRNAFNDPWFYDLDLGFEQDFPNLVEGLTSSFTIDFENFLNFIDDGLNVERRFDRGDVAEGVPVLDASLSADGTQFVFSGFPTSEIAFDSGFDRIGGSSLWAVQFGVKIGW